MGYVSLITSEFSKSIKYIVFVNKSVTATKIA